jgi:hypothetical protein
MVLRNSKCNQKFQIHTLRNELKDSTDTETPEGLNRLNNIHIRPTPVWEYTPQKPGHLFDRNGNPLTAVTVNQRLNKLFGKQASINMLRHTFLQGKFGDDIDKVKDIKQTFKNMGSSINMFENYVKH